MSRLFGLIVGLCLILAAAPTPAAAQTSDADPVMIPNQAGGSLRARQQGGVRISRPGALILASFDADGDMRVTPEERVAGAVRSFQTADVNADGVLSGFEQQDWAKAAGSPDGPLANALLFDSNLDRIVTPEEFSEGLERLARTYADQATGVVAFADLVAEPNNIPGTGDREGAPGGFERTPGRQPRG